MSDAVIDERLDILVSARLATSSAPMTTADFARALRRFAPPTLDEARWAHAVDDAVARVSPAGGLPTRDRLERALGSSSTATWPKLADRYFPLLALGVSMDDAKASARIKDRDSWTAAIAGRLLGLWSDGAPPSLSHVCDAYAWRQLGLTGKPKRCPPEVRALFLQRELATNAAPPDRLLRLYVAREVGVARAELRGLRDALVRHWLVGTTLGKHAPRNLGFTSEVREATRAARDGLFGDRKVFISSVWDDLRQRPTWASISLDEFKRQLVSAHRAGHLVLARADLVAAMDPALVALSETLADGASFHFIVREDAP